MRTTIRMKKNLPFALACLLTLGACTAELTDPGGVPASAPSIDDGDNGSDIDNDTGDAPALPPSLRGSEPDGDLRLDQDGRFVADADAMRFFDYFLTAEGELPDHALHALVHEAIARRLPAAAAGQASEAFERYLDYRAEAARIVADPDQTVADARDRLLRLHAERVAHVPGLAADPVLFNRAAALHRVMIQPGLDRAVRAARVAEVETALPIPGQDRRPAAQRETHLLQRLHQAEQRLHARGGSAAELRALRADLVGPAAAERLARLDQERARWQQRVLSYQRARAAADSAASRTLDHATPEHTTRDDASFTPRERLRLRAHFPAR